MLRSDSLSVINKPLQIAHSGMVWPVRITNQFLNRKTLIWPENIDFLPNCEIFSSTGTTILSARSSTTPCLMHGEKFIK